MSITDSLSKIQQGLKAPKGQYNSFGKYKYRNCEDILTAVKPLLDGGTVTLTDDIVMVGNRIYVKAIATFQKGGESVSVSAFAREPEEKKGMDASQVTGAASSYARKYALNGLFAIDDTKDADSDEGDTNGHSSAKSSNGSYKPKETSPSAINDRAKQPAPTIPSTPTAPQSSAKKDDLGWPPNTVPAPVKTPAAPQAPQSPPEDLGIPF